MVVVCLAIGLLSQDPRATIRVEVRAEGAPVVGASVAIAGVTHTTSARADFHNEYKSDGDVALTPRHSAGVVAMSESDDIGRVGVEVYFTGRQRLEVNPYRAQSEPYVILGVLAERRLGAVRLFVNGENLTGVRQTRWDPQLRPARAADGRWTIDAWAPLDGRTINGGIRVRF